MPDKLSLYNGALRLLGQRSLASLTETREPRYRLDESWNDGIQNATLEAGWWKFATRTVQLSPNPSFVRQFGYNYQYTRPDDYVRLGAFTSEQYARWTIDDYISEGGFFYTDISTVWMSYVSNDPSFGLNYSIWPESFNKFAQGMLAVEAAPRFKKTPAERKDIDEQVAKMKHDALSKDQAEGPVKKFRPGSWVRARLGGSYPGDRLRGGRLTG